MNKENKEKLSKRLIENNPMHNAEFVQAKVESFARNFKKSTKRRYSIAMKRRWADPESRAKLLESRKGKDASRVKSIKKANIFSRLKKSRLKRSKSKEIMESNKRMNKNCGKEIKYRREIKERKNDYCGVITESDLGDLGAL